MKTRTPWFWVWLTGLNIIICMTLLLMPGCDSQKTKPVTKLEDDVKGVQKTVTETKKAVEGNQNIIKETNKNVQLNRTEITKIVEQVTQPVQKGLAANAKKIEGFQAEINNQHNSTILMIVLFIISAGLNVLLILILFWVVRKLFSIRTLLRTAVAAPDNDLDEMKLGNYAKLRI